jgi:hypothetical protein
LAKDEDEANEERKKEESGKKAGHPNKRERYPEYLGYRARGTTMMLRVIHRVLPVTGKKERY